VATLEGWPLVRGTKWYKCTTVGHRKVASLEGVASHKRAL
jgi:hypothetical protein